MTLVYVGGGASNMKELQSIGQQREGVHPIRQTSKGLYTV